MTAATAPDPRVLEAVDGDEGEQGAPSDVSLGDEQDASESFAAPLCFTEVDGQCHHDDDELSKCIELCFASAMAKVVLPPVQLAAIAFNRDATLRVYVSAAAKRAVVVKEDDLLRAADIATNPRTCRRRPARGVEDSA